MTAVRFQRRGDIHAVTFAYDPMIVELLKASVPSFIRSWNPDRREWLILEPVYATQFADTLRRLGHTILGIDDPPQRQHTTDPAGWGLGPSSNASDPTGHHWPTNCCPGCATPITAAITTSRWSSTAPTPNYPRKGEPHDSVQSLLCVLSAVGVGDR